MAGDLGHDVAKRLAAEGVERAGEGVLSKAVHVGTCVVFTAANHVSGKLGNDFAGALWNDGADSGCHINGDNDEHKENDNRGGDGNAGECGDNRMDGTTVTSSTTTTTTTSSSSEDSDDVHSLISTDGGADSSCASSRISFVCPCSHCSACEAQHLNETPFFFFGACKIYEGCREEFKSYDLDDKDDGSSSSRVMPGLVPASPSSAASEELSFCPVECEDCDATVPTTGGACTPKTLHGRSFNEGEDGGVGPRCGGMPPTPQAPPPPPPPPPHIPAITEEGTTIQPTLMLPVLSSPEGEGRRTVAPISGDAVTSTSTSAPPKPRPAAVAARDPVACATSALRCFALSLKHGVAVVVSAPWRAVGFVKSCVASTAEYLLGRARGAAAGCASHAGALGKRAVGVARTGARCALDIGLVAVAVAATLSLGALLAAAAGCASLVGAVVTCAWGLARMGAWFALQVYLTVVMVVVILSLGVPVTAVKWVHTAAQRVRASPQPEGGEAGWGEAASCASA